VISDFEVDTNRYPHIFIVSSFQCSTCVDSLFNTLHQPNFTDILDHSYWIAPHSVPPEFMGHTDLVWKKVNQSLIEEYIPYASNVTYIQINNGELTKFEELGLSIFAEGKLKALFTE
jgi:hypothetical protein